MRAGVIGLIGVLALGSGGCASVREAVGGVFTSRAERLAGDVVIQRDEWGVPHIRGATDAAAAFGVAYAQAEDRFREIEERYIRALGRAAELYGEEAVVADLVRAAFEVERLAREEYEREPPERRALWDAYALGLEYYLETHPEVQPRLTRFEPWFVFALQRSVSAGMTVDGITLRGVIPSPVDGDTDSTAWQQVGILDPDGGEPAEHGPVGPIAWAVAPARSETGHALLFASGNGRFFSGGQPYELSIRSDEGWHFSGVAMPGSPVPHSGHNEHLAWGHTRSAADVADVWEVAFDDPANPLAYRYGGEWRQAVEWEHAIRVRLDSTLVPRRFRFRKTHHGPVVASADGKAYAVRIARFEDGGALQQHYAMGRAASLEEFRAALALMALPGSNTMYADRDGNIMYVHGGAVPKRDVAFDWTAPVDGGDPAAEWQGYHPLDELPQVLNPPGGWLQNASSTPFLATADAGNPSRDDFPPYLALDADGDRAHLSRAILSAESAWTLDGLAAAAFDTRFAGTDTAIALIVNEWERLGAVDPMRAAQLDPVVDSLRAWDRVSTIASVPTTWFVLWREGLRQPAATQDEWPRVTALEGVMTKLRRDWGRTEVAWGDINRLQRTSSDDDAFDPEAPSVPVAGAPGSAGVLFDFRTRTGPDGRLRFGTAGRTWARVVELAPAVRARGVVTFGQSADPTSPHRFDQAPLYGRGELRDVWFHDDDVARVVRRSYRPGEAADTAVAR